MTINRTDPIGRYLNCYQAVTGESLDFELLTLLHSGAIEKTSFKHAIHDGQGALLKNQHIRGEAQIVLPQQRKEQEPGILRQVFALARYLILLRQGSKSTLSISYAPSTKQEKTFTEGQAWKILSIEKTLELQDVVKRCGVSMTSFLLWTLHQAIGVQLGLRSHICRWSVPVSLRGAINLGDATANHAVPLFLHLDSKDRLQDVHKMLRTQLENHLHWGAWRLLVILNRLNSTLYRQLIIKDQVQKRAQGQWFAILSNLGRFTGDNKILAQIPFGLINPSNPLSASTVTWNGRMSLALHMHEVLQAYQLNSECLLESWLQEIFKFSIGSVNRVYPL